ncbi:hypothetical protein [Massilia timonae]|uniref:hypothetical protein n=1 Tax=Massilia timonae TaxID=47229 RepID=UPI00289BA5E1|nr:hypothetical protein [Massilia timonae]
MTSKASGLYEPLTALRSMAVSLPAPSFNASRVWTRPPWRTWAKVWACARGASVGAAASGGAAGVVAAASARLALERTVRRRNMVDSR